LKEKNFTKNNLTRKVFSLVKRIPKGKISTYKQIAIKLKKPKAARLIGKILSKNKHLIKIPCHRIVKSNGSIGGFILGEKKKSLLLKKEGIKIKKGKIIDFKKHLIKFN